MADYVADAEGTTAGAAITTGAGLVFTSKNVPGTSSVVTDNTNCADGSRCYLFTIASGDAAYLQQTPVGGAGSAAAMRGKLSAAAAPANTQVIARFLNTSNGAMANLNVTSTGFFQISDSTGSSAAGKGETGAVSIPWAVSTHVQWRFRVEKGTTTSDGKHYAEWYSGQVLQESLSATAANTTTIDVGTFRLGRASSVASAWTYRLDTILMQTSTTSFPPLAEAITAGVTMTMAGDLTDSGVATGGTTVAGVTMTLAGGQDPGVGTGAALTSGEILTAAGTVLPGSAYGAGPPVVTVGVTMELTGAVTAGAVATGAALVAGVTIGGASALLSGAAAGGAVVAGVTMTGEAELPAGSLPATGATVAGVTMTCTGQVLPGAAVAGAVTAGVTITGSGTVLTGTADAFRVQGPFGLPFAVTGPLRLPFAVTGPVEAP